MIDGRLATRVRTWIDDDPDPQTRAELEALLAESRVVVGVGVGSGSTVGEAEADATAPELAEIADRFSGMLEFGTAGLRGIVGAGPNRMNRAVVRRAAIGLARHLLEVVPDAAERGVVIGRDARHGSAEFAADSAAVIAGAGLRVTAFPTIGPTPWLAYAVRRLGTAAGIMVTASHNPAPDNGYKVYWGDGAQIRPPVDAHIAAHMLAVERVRDLPLAPRAVEPIPDDLVAAYENDVLALLDPRGSRQIGVVYTAMHGVGGAPFCSLFDKAGFAPPHRVQAQFDPDPEFPTVAFPNPEEPGALDRAVALARETKADVIIANDPDADRLAVAIPDRFTATGWRTLSGDETGALLAEHLLARSLGALGLASDERPRLVVSTVASGTLVERIAEHHGAASVRTLTGFKWIEAAAITRPDHRFVLGYEEALGYDVGGAVRDKDGLSAGLVMAELVATLRAQGSSITEMLAELAQRHGLHVTRPWTLRVSGADGLTVIARGMARLRATPPVRLGGRRVETFTDLLPGFDDLPPTDGLILTLEDRGRVVIRPSGTEPKLKAYLEVVTPAHDRPAADAALNAVEADLARLLAG